MKFITILFFIGGMYFLISDYDNFCNDIAKKESERIIKYKTTVKINENTKYIISFKNGDDIFVDNVVYYKFNVGDTVYIDKLDGIKIIN